MKIKLFTHTDLDGIGCAIIGKYAFGSDIDIEYVDYHNVNDIVAMFINDNDYRFYDKVFITDISINETIADTIERLPLADNFQLLDHHETALWLNKYNWANVTVEDRLIDNNETDKTSGTYMFYEHLLNNEEKWSLYHINEFKVLSFADIVRKYDTWQWKNKYNDIIPKQWNDLYYILGRERFIEQTLSKIVNNDVKLNKNDLMLLELEQEKIDRYIENKYKNIIIKNIQGYATGIVFAEQYHSELGNRLSEMHQGLDFITIINIDKSVSYRTTKDYIHLGNDIAKIYNGGGHAQAAGSPISDKVKEIILNNIFQ